jgi:osmotically-inducible protein OsmY
MRATAQSAAATLLHIEGMKTDWQILEDVIAELKHNSMVGAARIYVGIREGEITLSGYVNNQAERAEAARAVRSVTGVKSVCVEMRLLIVESMVRSDA